MYKKLLLASSLVASAVSMQAAEYYIVKDGKVADGVELLKSTQEKITVEEGVEAPGGEGTYLKYNVALTAAPVYTGRMFYVADGINMDDAWMCDVTYFFAEGSVLHPENLKRESMRLDFLGDTLTVDTDTFRYDYNQKTRRFAHLGYDFYFRDFYRYNAETEKVDSTVHGVGMDRTVSRYIYTNPNFKDATGSHNIVKTVSLACFQECPVASEKEATVYIKDIKIYSKGVKPFYNEPFHSFIDAAYISGGGKGFMKYIDDKNGSVAVNPKASSLYEYKELYGASYLAGTNTLLETKPGFLSVTTERLWQSEGVQCKDGIFFDTEVGLMLHVTKSSRRKENPVYVRVPFDDVVAKAGESINAHLMIGHNACLSCGAYTLYDMEGSPAPLQYRFEKGDLDSYSEATDWTAFSTMDTLPINVNVVEEEIIVPEGGYNIITIGFFPQKDVSYVIGDMQLRGARSVIPANFGSKADDSDVSMPFTFTANVEVVEADGLDIYPNPAVSEFVVSADVEKVEVISIAGNVVLATNSNVVNVENLAKGMYVVKAYTESGIKTARIIKK